MNARRPVAIIGDGKMGRAIRDLAPEMGCDVVAFLGERDLAHRGPTTAQLAGAAVAIEFTVPEAAARNVEACAKAGVPVVCGTTGWDAARPAVEAAVWASNGALLWAPNFSPGVHLFARLVEYAAAQARRLPTSPFAAHLVDMHHAAKKDAPSGTAKLLAARASGAGETGVPITSIRVGSVPGTHEFVLDGPFEQIRLVHEARDRRVFAAGALQAAAWLVGRRGVFTFDDFLGTNG
ncbi:MAG: dihydrodipicolinate reductase [Gemmatimonadetes bacterium]|nr:dihydrodipicolinate reductase [Gemmatimonadota bacterium]